VTMFREYESDAEVLQRFLLVGWMEKLSFGVLATD
jgi:hypothetical protein